MVAVVICPTCSQKVEWLETNKFRPFCCERCKQIDLGAWAEEKFAIPAITPPEDFDEDDLSRQQ